MPVPTINSVTPAAGPTGGLTLVEILGTGFQLPPVPPPTGKTVAPNPSVEVLFGTKKGKRVAVISTTRLLVLAPAQDPGAFGVTVRNIYQDGSVIPGESVTAASAFTFARPSLDTESELARLVRHLLRELKRQVIEEVVNTVHTDYDKDKADLLNRTEIAKLPCILLSGPDLDENRFYSINAARRVSLGGGLFAELRTPVTVDLVFEVNGIDDKQTRLLNLMAATESFFARNDYISMPRDANAPDGEQVSWEMDVLPGGNMKIVSTPSNSNIRQFSGTIIIRGFDIDEPDMVFAKTKQLEDVVPTGSVNQPSAIILDGQGGIPIDPATGIGGQGGGEPLYQIQKEDP